MTELMGILELSTILAGIVVCTAGGLLGLLPDPDRPARFLPVYAVAVALFLVGLGLILWFQPTAAILDGWLAEQTTAG